MANVNPFRYRGYYMDVETGYYYLQSRYYDPAIRRFISSDSYDLISTLAEAGDINLFAYCSNNPVMYTDPTGEFAISLMVGFEIATVATGGVAGGEVGFKIFGYELRKSAGWENSPDIATGILGRIGISSYITHTQGRSGLLYVFAGSISDVMNWFGTTYYAGVGINIFDIIGVEVQLETVGVGVQVCIGKIKMCVNINLIGGTSITFGWDSDLGNGMTRTDGFTIGANTGGLFGAIYWIYKLVTIGDASPVPGFNIHR